MAGRALRLGSDIKASTSLNVAEMVTKNEARGRSEP